jgi:hypothetical protein
MTETEAIRQNYELGVMAGEARERQRIIKLLEDRIARCKWIPEVVDPRYDDQICQDCEIASELIDEIKGEK